MFHEILVPVDLTDKNTKALKLAKGLVAPGGKVTMLHVIETLDAPFEELADFYQRLEQQARAKMNELARSFGQTDAELEERVCYGKRAAEIISYARDEAVDLIIIGSHPVDPETPEQRFMTISHQVAILSPNPVLVLK